MSISKILYQTLCVFSQIKDRKHIEQNFHSVAKVAPGRDFGVLGESKTLALGFAMAPNRLRPLVLFVVMSCCDTLHQLLNDIFEPRHEISNKAVCATSKGSDQPAQTRSLTRTFASRLNII